MASNTGMSALGVGAIGFGTLLVWSAYTGKPLFGSGGLIDSYYKTNSFAGAGKGVAKTLNDVGKIAKNQPSSTTNPGKVVNV